MLDFTDDLAPILRKHGMTAELPFPSTDCPAGWLPVVDELLGELRALGLTRVTQIKEKFGRLTVYLVQGASEEAEAAVDRAEKKCATICETCSAAGNLRRELSWIRVLCDGCLSKRSRID